MPHIPRNSSGSLESFTEKEVRTHDDESSAWIVLDGFVYDVTSFLGDHPGGKEIVLPYLGRDATAIFSDEREHVHSEAAYNILKKYRIGVLLDTTARERKIANERIEGLVDVTKAMVPQVWRLGADYDEWIHTHTGMDKIIIFPNFLEIFTRWPWWYIFIFWSPVLVYLMYQAIAIQHIPVPKVAMLVFAGVFIWAGVEYILHRFIFHVKTSSPVGNMFHFFIHGIHHITPMDTTRLTFPPMFALFVGFFFLKSFLLFMSPQSGVHALFAGSILGYVMYDTLHYYFHHGEKLAMPSFVKKLKTLHLNHHYKDDTKNYGVTSPLFDFICGTA